MRARISGLYVPSSPQELFGHFRDRRLPINLVQGFSLRPDPNLEAPNACGLLHVDAIPAPFSASRIPGDPSKPPIANCNSRQHLRILPNQIIRLARLPRDALLRCELGRCPCDASTPRKSGPGACRNASLCHRWATETVPRSTLISRTRARTGTFSGLLGIWQNSDLPNKIAWPRISATPGNENGGMRRWRWV